MAKYRPLSHLSMLSSMTRITPVLATIHDYVHREFQRSNFVNVFQRGVCIWGTVWRSSLEVCLTPMDRNGYNKTNNLTSNCKTEYAIMLFQNVLWHPFLCDTIHAGESESLTPADQKTFWSTAFTRLIFKSNFLSVFFGNNRISGYNRQTVGRLQATAHATANCIPVCYFQSPDRPQCGYGPLWLGTTTLTIQQGLFGYSVFKW